ncbi:glycosyltransferase [Allohahella marinimesophila]|uniref:Rhamnosyltransferase n=1 Tax=Allohahella marinimesophila TaxID=1054972 RepID=A0ABP7P8X7_9GAMM
METASKGQICHLILTRFNVRSGGKEAQIRQDPTWLKTRFDLFEKYCLPSVKKQSDKSFKWLIFFDLDTPDYFKQKVIQYVENCDQIVPTYVGEWNSEAVKSAIASQILPEHRFVLSTRLDNDDAIHIDFIKTLQLASRACGHDVYLNFPKGMTYASGVAYSHLDRSNAFISRMESVSDFHGVWELKHVDIASTRPIVQLDLKFAWLQVVHGRNVSNKIRGRILKNIKWIDYYPYSVGRESKMVNAKDILGGYIRTTLQGALDILIRAGRTIYKKLI